MHIDCAFKMGTIKDEEFKDVVERFLENVAFPRFKRYFRLCGGGNLLSITV